jgi:hypothetical protein
LPPDIGGAYFVIAAQLTACAAHCHLNTTIVSRRFFTMSADSTMARALARRALGA